MPAEQYRRTCTRIGIAVLLNTFLLQVLTTIVYMTTPIAESGIRDYARANNIDPDQFFYAFKETLALAVYLVSFLIPVFIFMIMSRKDGREPMRLEVRLEPETPLVIIAAIGTILIASYFNSMMVSFIDFSAILESDPIDTPVKILLSFISIAIVPAVAEEFLFRGCVLSNLLPYGKTNALIVSALLFSLMHGNFAQFFYTFVAGLVLGAVYIETGSIWTSTFIHLFNNFYSIIRQILYERLGESEYANILLFSIDVILTVAGLAIGAWLLYKRVKKDEHTDVTMPTKRLVLEKGEAVRGFFRPVVIAHIVLSLILAMTIILAVLTGI